MERSPVRTGDQVKLRVQILDSNQEPIEATGVTVDLFDPTQDIDVDTPVVTGLTPTYLGNGVFEVTFTAGTPGGGWIDSWTADILGTTTTFTGRFTVLDSGIIVSYPNVGLDQNTLIELFLSKDIADTSGNTLESDNTFLFTTLLTPFYSSSRKVRLDAGGMLGDLPDSTINLAILEASIEADILSFNKCIVNNNLYIHARRQYVTCLAAMILAQNVLTNGGVVKRKELDDFKVEYDLNSLGDLMNRLNDCIKKWEQQVQAGGGSRAIRNPQMVIKGELDPDRPSVGRLWYGMSDGETPIGNVKYRVQGSRRWRTGFINTNRKSWSTDW